MDKGYWGREGEDAVQVFGKLEKWVAAQKQEKHTPVMISSSQLAKCIQLKGLYFILSLWGFLLFCFVTLPCPLF